MIRNNNKLGKIDTRNLLRHATARSSTKTVATMLGVADTRISEGKRGDWQLTREHAEKLRVEFGSPLSEAGLFLHCEVWDSLGDMQIESDGIYRCRQWHRVMEVIHHPEFWPILASLVGAEQNADREMIRNRIGSMLQDAELVSWYHNCKETLSCESYSFALQGRGAPLSLSSSVLSDSGINITEIIQRHCLMPSLEWYVEHQLKHHLTLILLGELASNRSTLSELTESPDDSFRPFVDPWPAIDVPQKATLQEVVMTGDIIWRERTWITPPMVPMAIMPLTGISLSDLTSRLASQSYSLQWLIGFFPDQHNHLDLQVAMTKHLNYHLLLTLSLQDNMVPTINRLEDQLSANLEEGFFVEWLPARQVVIRDVKSDKLLDVIHQVYSWLGLPSAETFSLKREIAQNGGYLPGALYLE